MKINTSNSKVEFIIKKLFLIKVKGTFSTVNGNVEMNESTGSIDKIYLATSVKDLDTKNGKRNEHLQQKDFFNTEKFPEITFKSSDVTKVNNGYSAKGELDLTGTKKMVTIPFKFENNRATGEFSINRKDFSLGKLPPFVAANNVDITFDCAV